MPSGDRRDRTERREKKDKRRSQSRRRRSVNEEQSGVWGFFLSKFCCCSEVKYCPTQERIPESRHRRHRDRDEGGSRGDRDADRERRRQRRREERAARKAEEEGGPGPGAGALPAASRTAAGRTSAEASDNASSGGRSARSCTSYASYASDMTGVSEATEATSARSSRSARSGRGGSRRDGSRHDEGPVKVMNLADLRGQELPGGLEKQLLPAKKAGDEEGQSGAPLSARSGRSCRSDAQSVGGASMASVSIKKYMGYLSEDRSPGEVKKMVKDFVKQMVKGREMGVLRADGALKPVMCALARSLDVFRIKSGTEVRKLKLSEVERVVHGSPEELSDLETPLDDACSTMELQSSECISFKFAERKAAELFTLCMQLFIDGQRQ